MLSGVETDLYLREARRVAVEAGNRLLSWFGSAHAMDFKAEINPVTVADRESEAFIVKALKKTFPDHGFISEEGTHIASDSPWIWIVDPLDGTTNYAHGFCMWSVSIALLKEENPVAGVIYIPKLGEEFYAARGRGAFLNGQPVHVSKERELSRGFLTTGVPYSVRENLDFHIGLYRGFLEKALAVRRAGSACIDLCYVAAGRFDGYWEAGLQPWDAAAGILLVEEAGGSVTDFSGQPYWLRQSGTLVASNGALHNAMLEVLKG